MARGDKNYDKVVRRVNKGQKAEKKIGAIHKMVEALIAGNSDLAAERLHDYLQEKTRELILGEKKNEKPDFADIDKDGNKKESMKKAAKDKKSEEDEDKEDPEHEEKESAEEERKERKSGKEDEDEDVKESVSPRANLTRARGPKFAAGADRGNISGNSLRDKPKKSNDTKARGPKFSNDSAKGKISGNSLKKKPHKSNDTKARGPEFSDESGKGSVADCDDGRDYNMGTGNISEGAPSAGMTKKEKSAVAKKARAGKDIGKKGKNFKKVAAKAAKEYGSKEAGERVAAAAMWKNQAKK